MGRYGEQGRVYINNILYIISVMKIQSEKRINNPFTPFICFERSIKSGVKLGYKNKMDKKFRLDKKTFNMTVMKAIEKQITKYLKKWDNEYISFMPDIEEQEKRVKLYNNALKRNGYEYVFKQLTEDKKEYIYYYHKNIKE